MKEKHLKLHIGTKIKEQRGKSELRQEDVANVLNLSRSSIVNIEIGRHGTTMHTLFSLCRLFKCTPNDLFPPVEPLNFIIEEKFITVKKKVKRLKVLKR